MILYYFCAIINLILSHAVNWKIINEGMIYTLSSTFISSTFLWKKSLVNPATLLSGTWKELDTGKILEEFWGRSESKLYRWKNKRPGAEASGLTSLMTLHPKVRSHFWSSLVEQETTAKSWCTHRDGKTVYHDHNSAQNSKWLKTYHWILTNHSVSTNTAERCLSSSGGLRTFANLGLLKKKHTTHL